MALSVQVPTNGQANSTEAVKVTNTLTNLNTWANGGIAGTDLSPTAAIARSQMAGGFGNLAWASVAGPTNAVDGTFYGVTAATTITLPAPTLNRTIGIMNNVAGVVTVTASSGTIVGQGLSAVSFTLGTPNAAAVLVANGTNWLVVAGQQDTGWVALGLVNSWGQGSGYVPAYRLQADTVSLRGATNTAGVAATIATLPAGFRPAQIVQFSASIGLGSNYIQVLTSGVVSNLSGSGVAASLDSVRFPLT